MGRWPLNCHVNAAQLFEPAARSFWEALRNSVKIAIEADKHRVLPCSVSRHNRVRAIRWKLIDKAHNLMAPAFEEGADRFRHTMVSKELDRFEMLTQAANLCVRRADCTSLTVSAGYSAIIASSE